jgi:phycocyanobilin lyase subunit beta
MSDRISELIQAVERADSADKLSGTVRALAAVRSEAAIPTLIEVLGYNNPGAAVAAVEGLIDLGEVVVPFLLKNLDGYNYGARAWAIRVFAGIGDPRALDLLIAAASTDFSLSVRRAAAKGLGFIRWSNLPPQEVLTAQTEVLKTLLLVSQDEEWVVRYGAIVALQALASAIIESKPNLVGQILERLEQIVKTDSEIAIRARAQMALQNCRTNE